MRLVRVCLIAIALMVPCRLAHSGTHAICAAIAGNSANPMATNVDEWLTRFRESYAACLSQHQAAEDISVPAKDLREIKAVKPGKKTPPEILRTEKKLSKPKHQSAKRAIPKTTKEIQALPAEYPANLPAHGSRLIRAPKTKLPDAGAESWRVNCSQRFGGFNKASETYLSSAGKRVSCALRPKNARG